MERKQDEALQSMFNRFERTINDINIQYNTRIENRNVEDNNIQNNRHEIRTRRSTPSTTNSNTTEERETTVTEPPLQFYEQITSMSINEEPQIEQNISSGSVPTTIRPFDGTDPAYSGEDYLSSIVAAMIFSSGIEPVNKPGHHQWRVKRAALILHTLQGPAQKWYSTLPSETKLDWETFCKEFSDMFDSEKSKQQAKIVLQQLQKHTNESLRSLALRIETFVKTAYSLYTEDYRNSVMNQTFIRCLDNELKTAALKKHANHKQTPREPEMPFKALIDKIDPMDLTRTITNHHKRLYEINQTTNNINDDLKQMNIACNNINDLNQNDLEQFEGTICNVLNGINNTYDRKNFKGRPKFALFCSYCSSHGHTKGRCFKRPRRESIPRSKEKTFHGHMRNNQNLPNRRIDSNNVNGRQLPSTSPVYNSSRSRTPYRSQSRNNYNNMSSIKETMTRITNIIIEIQVTIETISIEVEQTATTEIIIIIDITIVDQAQDTQIAVNQDTNHRITEIIIIVIIIITDKDLITEIQIELIDTDKDQIAITDIIQTITIEMIEEIRHIENKITDINQKTEEQMETNITIITIKAE